MKSQGTYLAYVHREIMRVVPVYVGLACLVLFFALLIARTTFPPLGEAQQLDITGELETGHLRRATLWLAVVAQFFYCGAQVSTWSALIPYLKQYTALPERSTAYFLMGNLVAYSGGRFIATGLMKWIRPMRLVGLYAVVNIVMVCVSAIRPGMAGAICLLITSFFMAPMFPTIFASGVEGLGKATKLCWAMLPGNTRAMQPDIL
jgi:FHS family L-fucose permease-like MFS transporter